MVERVRHVKKENKNYQKRLTLVRNSYFRGRWNEYIFFFEKPTSSPRVTSGIVPIPPGPSMNSYISDAV